MSTRRRIQGLVAAMLISLVTAVACVAESEDVGEGSAAVGGGTTKVAVCHIPPGNPANAHTIVVGEPAVQAHLAHGDTLGECTDAGDFPDASPPPGTDATIP